ncbi:MAG: class I SAM-dependent methyltransferase [Caulobacteraceae bacterium]
MIDPALLALLRCPASGLTLRQQGLKLVSADDGHEYAIASGIPCLIASGLAPTHGNYTPLIEHSSKLAGEPFLAADTQLIEYLNGMLVPTCGNLFRGVTVSSLDCLPIPPSECFASPMLDIGCNWGRWTIAAARAGVRVIGVDIHLEGLLYAQQLARRLAPADNQPQFVLADARKLPFAPSSFATTFSYSVVQHFSRPNAAAILSEVGRVTRPGGRSLVQMPNVRSIRGVIDRTARLTRKPAEFDVRYYRIEELIELFDRTIGRSSWSVDCYLGLNVHGYSRNLINPRRRWIVDLAEWLARRSAEAPWLGRFADSVWLSSVRT